MPPTGTIPALTEARVGMMRMGGSRLGYVLPIPYATINGVVRTNDVRLEGASIRDILNSTPNTATMRVDGTAPTEGHEVVLNFGVSGPTQFRGRILSTTKIYEAGNPQNIAWDCQCISEEWLLNKTKVTKRYLSTSATAILLDLMATYAPGFSAAGVASGLPSLDEITFTSEDVTDCLDRICQRIGEDWQLDYAKVLHVPAADGMTANAITDSDYHGMSEIKVTTDLSQLKTRQSGEGGGSNASVDVAIGQNTLPVDLGSWYQPAGGTVKSGPQTFPYTGKSTMDGTGSTVAGDALSPGTPSAAVAAGTAGKLSEGAYQYQASFVLPAGESEASAASGSATITAVTAPSAPSGAQDSGVSGNLTVGNYGYKATYETAAGETLASSASGSVAIGDISAPSAPSGVVVSAVSGHLRAGTYLYKETGITAAGETVASSPSTVVAVSDVGAPSAPSVALLSGLGHLVGAYGYKASFVGSYGETLPGSVGSRTAVAVSAPGAPSRAQVSNTVGNLIGQADYLWKVSFITPDGETLPGTATSALTIASISDPGAPSGGSVKAGGAIPTAQRVDYAVVFVTADGHTTNVGSDTGFFTLTAGNQTVELTGVPLGPAGVTARRIYRRDEFGGLNTFRYVGEIPDNITTVYVDDLANVGGSGPSANINGRVSLTSIPTGPTGTLARGIYRTKADGSEYFSIGQLSDNTTTAFTDDIPDTALTVAAPLVATAGGEQHTVTFSTGPSGTTARRLWRTDAGGTLYRLLAEITDNTTTTFADNTPDALLGGSPPNTSTAVGGQITVTLPVHSDARVVKRNVYRTEVNGSTYYLLTTINDNSDTSFLDNIPDSSLGGIPPATGSAGTGRITVTIPTSSDGRVTKRGLYRTAVGGSDYKQIATIGNNTDTTFADNVPDTSRGNPEPTLNDAGSGQIAVSSIPLGPAGTTARQIYRTEADGTVFKFLRILTGNVSTSFTDNGADSSLGEVAPVNSTVGALAGATSLRVKDLALHPAAGWVRVGEQLVRYTGRSGSSGEGTLTGIPASGIGSIGAGLAADVSVVNHPHLTGVTGVLYAIKHGDQVNIWVTRNDTAAQAFMAAALTTATYTHDGIIEADPIQDRRMSETEITARCDAKLEELTPPLVTVRYVTPDFTAVSGRDVTVTLGAPVSISGTFKIQSVTTTGFSANGEHRPMKQVECSSRLLTFEQVLRIRKAAA